MLGVAVSFGKLLNALVVTYLVLVGCGPPAAGVAWLAQRSLGLSDGSRKAMELMLRYLVVSLGLVGVAMHLGINSTALIAVAGGLSVGLGFGIKEVFSNILRLTVARGVPSYLGVMKRHRADAFLLSHGLDGYSFALDFPVTPSNRSLLFKTLHEVSDMVCEAGGRFYPAKDSVIRPDHVLRSWGQARLSRFEALRDMVDPDRRLRTELAARFGLVP